MNSIISRFSTLSYLRILTILSVIFSQPYAQADSSVCYGRSGVQEDDLFSCQPDAVDAACCAAGNICYSNGLCAPGPTSEPGITPFFWNGCTDANYNSSSCFSGCS